MEWTAQTFIDRVLTPPSGSPWWAGHQSERSLEKKLAQEVRDIPDFLGRDRKLFFSRLRETVLLMDAPDPLVWS